MENTKGKTMMTYMIPGNPIAWKRAGINGKKFFDQQTQDKSAYRIVFESQHDAAPFDGPLLFDITFFMKIPASLSPGQRARMHLTHHSIKPDASNLLKFIEDAATGILYFDDRQIAQVKLSKYWSLEPRTLLTIKPLNPHDRFDPIAHEENNNRI